MGMPEHVAAQLVHGGGKGVHGTMNVGRGKENYSQASSRGYRIFTDQYSREYGADVENNTQHPCGPWQPRFRAPLMPHNKYLVIVDTVRGKLILDIWRWRDDLVTAHEDYRQQCIEWHQKLGLGRTGVPIWDPETGELEPQIRTYVGQKPMELEVLDAMLAGNRWLLGIPNVDGSMPEKPQAALRFFPDRDPDAPTRIDPLTGFDAPIDPWAEGTEAGEEARAPKPEAKVDLTFPYHYGGGWWWLSAEHKANYEKGESQGFKGTQEEAETAARVDAVPGVQSVVPKDPSWEG